MSGDDDRPLIVSAKLDAESFARLDGLRRAHFPTTLNRLSAHLTLFHHLPGDRAAEVVDALVAATATAPPSVAFTGLRSLGRGVAFEASSPGLAAARAVIVSRFRDALTAQDAQGFRPHVTVQNKVAPEAAHALKAGLEDGFSLWTGAAEAMQLWRYAGGPWEAAGEFAFRG